MSSFERLGREILNYLELCRAMGVKRLKVPSRTAGSVTTGQNATRARTSEAPVPPLTAREPVRLAAPLASLFDEAPPAEESLETIRADLGDCRRCKLASGRRNIVFGSGNPHAELMFVGEAPGADEDEQGLPFVGRAGQLLTRIIEAMGMKREDVYICNILKCRPPGNRNPEADEIAACEPFLRRQIASVKPKIICALGTFGAQALLRTKEPISRLRGQFIDYRGIKLMATYHPAYLLRNPNEKRKVWEDVQKIRDYLKDTKA
jgi:uracil-DNA glycosylase family 4